MPTLTQTQDRWAQVVLLALFFVLIRLTNPMPPSDDLRALWLAGRFFEDGASGIYTLSADHFRMVPPDLWIDTFLAEDIGRPAYPFIYPPLWAWIMHHLVTATSFEVFAGVMGNVNAAAMCGCFYLASKMARGTMTGTAYIAVLLFITFGLGCLVITLPLHENQPQILVSFLVLLGIERTRAGHAKTGGAAMALAAALKLYPVIFALLWLAAGQKKSFAAFTIAGGTLGIASLAVGGLDLHIAFLSEVRSISASAILIYPNVTLDSLLGILLIDPGNTETISTAMTGGENAWRVYAKPEIWKVANTVTQIFLLIGLMIYARRTSLTDPLVWPVVIVTLAWFLPLSWLYHYLPAFAFLPALVARLGWKHGVYAMSVPVIVTSTAFFVLILSLPTAQIIAYPLLSGAIIWTALAFLWATRTSPVKPPL
jgi:hypothetical protein